MDAHLDPPLMKVPPGGKVTVLAELVLYDPTNMCHAFRTVVFGQKFTLQAVLNPQCCAYLIVNARMTAGHQSHLTSVEDTRVISRPPPNQEHILDVVETCSGIGCLGYGLEQSGFNVVLRNDQNHVLLDLGAKIFPSSTLCGDICQDETIACIVSMAPQAGTLAAGVSCQPYSRLGNQEGQHDSRSRTLPATLRAGFIMRMPVILLECVDAALTNEWVQFVLQSFRKLTGYHLKQGLLKLQDCWPTRRTRWWAILTHPLLGPIDWEPLPSFQPQPVVSHLIDALLYCEGEELEQLELDLYELRKFDSYGLARNLIPKNAVLPTSLHSCGNQLGGCPCGCRKHGFTLDRLDKGGLHGHLVQLEGKFTSTRDKLPCHRHVHPKELALLNGLSPHKPWGPNLRLSLCAIGQLASPIQALWIGSFVVCHLKEIGIMKGVIGTPTEVLMVYLRSLMQERDELFGTPQMDDSKKFAKMIEEGLTCMDQIPPALPCPGVSPLEIPQQSAVVQRDLSLLGGVPGFETNRKRVADTPMLPCDDPQSESKKHKSDPVHEGVKADEGVTTLTTFHDQVTEDDRIFNPAECNATALDFAGDASLGATPFVRLVSIGEDGFHVAKVNQGITAGQITQAEATLLKGNQPIAPKNAVGQHVKLQEIVDDGRILILHPMSLNADVHHCPIKTESTKPAISFPITREDALWKQLSWVAVDEMNFYLERLDLAEHERVVPAVYFRDDSALDLDGEPWINDLLLGQTEDVTFMTAVLCSDHWIPVIIHHRGGDVTLCTTPEGRNIQKVVANVCRAHNIGHFCSECVMHTAFPGDCGFQAINWLQVVIGKNQQPVMLASLAANMRESFHAELVNQDQHDVIIHSLRMGGMALNVKQRIKQLLIDYGVFTERADERSSALLQKIPEQQLLDVLKSNRPWAQLKTVANHLSPPFRLIMQDELDKQIEMRSHNPRPVKTKAKKTAKQNGASLVRVRAKDLNLPVGVFMQQGGPCVGQIESDKVGPNSQGVVLADEEDAQSLLKITKPISQHGLAVIVLAQSGDEPTSDNMVRFPVICRVTGEPMIILGKLYQLGSHPIVRHEPAQKMAVEVAQAAVVRCLVYRDVAGQVWDEMEKHPVKTIFQFVSEFRGSGDQSVVLDVWDRQWYTKRFEKTSFANADCFGVSIRILATQLDTVLAVSGNHGIFFEPRSPCGRLPNNEYHVIWLQNCSFQDAKIAQQTAPHRASLARIGDRFGLRCDTMNASDIHSKHKPDVPLLLGHQKQMYLLGPMPFSSTKVSPNFSNSGSGKHGCSKPEVALLMVKVLTGFSKPQRNHRIMFSRCFMVMCC